MTARRFFLLFGLCAVVPLVAAQLSLKFGWFSTVGTNKGIWMDKEIQLLPDLIAEPSSNSEAATIHWRLVYFQPEICDQGCERAMLTLQQLYSGLGRKQLKIKLLVVVPHGQTRKTFTQKLPDLDWQSVVDDTSGLENQIVIVNQRGLVLLRYPVTKEPKQMQDLAKNIRADLLHLINYDRSGA